MNTVKAIFWATRPKTLTAAFIPVAIATALAFTLGFPVYPGLIISALCSCLLIQAGTNLFNDAIDFAKGTDTKERLGPSRATLSGWLSQKSVFWLAVGSFVLAFLVGLPLMLQGGLGLILFFLISMACGYCYTGGPFSWSYLGLGDLFVLLFFGFGITVGVFYGLTGTLHEAPFLAGAQSGLLLCALLAINNLRDINQDRKANKKTLAVRFGVTFSRYEIATCIFLPFVLAPLWWVLGFPAAAVMPFLALPLAVKLIRYIFEHEPSILYNHFFEMSALLHLLFGLLLVLGISLQ